MLSTNFKRHLAFVMAMVLVLSAVPFQAFAAEAGTVPTSEPTTEATAPEETEEPTTAPEGTAGNTAPAQSEAPPAENTSSVPLAVSSESEIHKVSDAYQRLQDQIDVILDTYLLTKDTSWDGICTYVQTMNGELFLAAVQAITDFETAEGISLLSEDEQNIFLEQNTLFCDFATAVNSRIDMEYSASTIATDIIAGKVTYDQSTSSNVTVKVEGTKLEATVKGSVISKRALTLTIYNASAEESTLSFDFSAISYNSFKINDTQPTGTTWSGILAPGASVKVFIQSNSGLNDTTARLTLSSISLTPFSSSSTGTFTYNSDLGSITVDGNEVADGGTHDISAEGTTLQAYVKDGSGATFFGWINGETGEIYSQENPYNSTFGQSIPIEALFMEAESSYFLVGGASAFNWEIGIPVISPQKNTSFTVNPKYIFSNFKAAADKTEADSSSKIIIPLGNATLKKNATDEVTTYTVPSGSTLLIPFDASNTMYTTVAQSTGTGTYAAASAYRTLTMDAGVELVINGSLAVSAKHSYAAGGDHLVCAPSGKYGAIHMKEGSHITVNGNLYAYGYIYGDGTVTANSQSTVYEIFQILDFRGGTQSTGMENGVFPLNQYYIQNIEVPITFHSGSKEFGYATIYVSSMQFGSTISFIGTDSAMFNLTSGTLTKEYDGSTDRLTVAIDGNLSVSPIDISLGTGGINSKDYILPINGNMSVHLQSGTTTLAQDLAFIPGGELMIASGATFDLGTKKVIIYDGDNWGKYCDDVAKKLYPIKYSPTKTKTRTEADLIDVRVCVDGTLDAGEGALYTTGPGANICSSATDGGEKKVILTPGGDTVTYQYDQTADVYGEIPITPAKLKNDDTVSPYLITDTSKAATYLYNVEDKKWHKEGCTGYEQGATYAPTCTDYGYEHWECPCGNVKHEKQQPALGHDLVETPAEAATCTEAGTKGYWTCARDGCGKVFTASDGKTETTIDKQVIAALGHTMAATAAKPAACTASGNNAYYYCSRCKKYFKDQAGGTETTVAQETINPLGHDPRLVAANAATCTETGNNAYYDCSRCDLYFKDTDAKTETTVAAEVTPALGHTMKKTAAKAATCTEPGNNTYYSCSRCTKHFKDQAGGTETTVDQETISPLGHTYGNWQIATAPTFDTAGKRIKTCTACEDASIEEAFDSAQIGETPYQTLKEALAAAQECGTVKLLADISGEASVSQIVTIDKGDYSASITAAAGFALSENGSRVSVLGKIDSINIVAGDGLDLKFYVYTTAFKNSNYTAVITRTKADSTETVMIPFSEWGTEENGYYSFSYNGIAAKEMTDDITVFVKNSDDIQVSNETTQSIKSYATLTLKRKDNLVTDRLRTVLMDMLYYGASAQTHFGYKQDDLANADEAGSTVLADNAVYLSTTLPEANSYLKHDGYLGAVSVSAKSRLMLTFYFKSISTDMTAVITYTDHYGNPEKVIVPGSAFVTYGNMLGVDVTGLAVADGTALVECSLYQGTIEENTDLTTLTPVASATDSVEGYIARNGSGVVSLEYMLKFIHSARTYFSTP